MSSVVILHLTPVRPVLNAAGGWQLCTGLCGWLMIWWMSKRREPTQACTEGSDSERTVSCQHRQETCAVRMVMNGDIPFRRTNCLKYQFQDTTAKQCQCVVTCSALRIKAFTSFQCVESG